MALQLTAATSASQSNEATPTPTQTRHVNVDVPAELPVALREFVFTFMKVSASHHAYHARIA